MAVFFLSPLWIGFGQQNHDITHLIRTQTHTNRERKRNKSYQAKALSLSFSLSTSLMAEMGRPLPKFGEWDVNDPASAEGFTVIFNKARNEKRSGGRPESPPKRDSGYKHKATLGKPQSKKWFCCMQSSSAE